MPTIRTNPKWSESELAEQLIKQLESQGVVLSDTDKMVILSTGGASTIKAYGKISAKRDRS